MIEELIKIAEEAGVELPKEIADIVETKKKFEEAVLKIDRMAFSKVLDGFRNANLDAGAAGALIRIFIGLIERRELQKDINKFVNLYRGDNENKDQND